MNRQGYVILSVIYLLYLILLGMYYPNGIPVIPILVAFAIYLVIAAGMEIKKVRSR